MSDEKGLDLGLDKVRGEMEDENVRLRTTRILHQARLCRYRLSCATLGHNSLPLDCVRARLGSGCRGLPRQISCRRLTRGGIRGECGSRRNRLDSVAAASIALLSSNGSMRVTMRERGSRRKVVIANGSG